MMHFVLQIFLLAPLSFAIALPSALQTPSYADTNITLQEDIQKEWYSDWNSTSPSSQRPSHPAQFYSCAGPLIDDYPSKSEWLSFEDLWEINEPVLIESNNGGEYNDYVKEAIQDISERSKVNAGLILAIVMQESSGKVSVECTGPTSEDCGLMQLRGSRSFSQINAQQSITDMITDGVYGAAPQSDKKDTPYGTPGYLTLFNGIKSDLAWLGDDEFWRGNPFAAAHLYNSGGISGKRLNVVDGGVDRSRYYANDIASRLLGWDGGLEGCERGRLCSGLGFEARKCL